MKLKPDPAKDVSPKNSNHNAACQGGDQYVPQVISRKRRVTVWEVSTSHPTSLQNGEPCKKLRVAHGFQIAKGTALGKRT
jgi:hypothetical protein